MANKALYKNKHKRKFIRAIEKGAKLVYGRDLKYAWGGGRVGNHIIDPPISGDWTDCSGCASWLIEQAEKATGVKLIKNGAGSTWSLAEEGVAGTSPWFTMFIKNHGSDDHIILRLRRKWLISRKLFGEFRWVECGGSDNPKIGDGPAFFHPDAARIAEFDTHRRFIQL